MNEDLIIEYVNKFKQLDFPLPYQNIDILKSYDKLKGTSKPKSNTGIDLVYKFHPSLWLANKLNKPSPYQAWNDTNALTQCVMNRLKYKGDDLTPYDIVYGFSASYIAPKISLFRPALAKYLIGKYLNSYSEIFDPCSGYSGRLLGASILNKKYVGQDINKTTVRESNALINKLHLSNCEVHCKNSIATTGRYECLFTCPPYSDKENWGQSIEDLPCDEWIDICLNNYECESYLFVVDDTEKYKDNVVESIRNKSHFNDSTEKVVLITK